MSLPVFGNCRCSPNESHGESCPIIREFRNPAASRDAYHALLAERTAMAGQHNAVDVAYKLQRLGVPADALLAIRSPRQTAALGAAKRFISAPRALIRTLLLAGNKGCGKTTGAAWVLADAVRHYEWNSQASGGKQSAPFAWIHASEVTAATDFGKVDPAWLEGLSRARLLVIDDLGMDATAPGLAALGNLLSARHERHAPTVITSNSGPTTLKERYGEAWFDRLKSSSLAPDLSKEKSLRGRP